MKRDLEHTEINVEECFPISKLKYNVGPQIWFFLQVEKVLSVSLKCSSRPLDCGYCEVENRGLASNIFSNSLVKSVVKLVPLSKAVILGIPVLVNI